MKYVIKFNYGKKRETEMTKKILFVFILFNLLYADTNAQPYKVKSLKEQSALRNEWLKIRLDKVLPAVMKREGIDMWVIMNREYNEDPVYLTLVPQPSFSARRLSVLIFYLNPKGEFEKIIIAKRRSDDIYKNAWPDDIKDQWQAIAKVIEGRNPAKIGLNYSNEFVFGDGLTWYLKEMLMKNLNDNLKERIVSAEKVAVGWLETRIPEEMALYPEIVSIAHSIIAEAFSSKVIIPGTTTNEDVEWWMREKISSYGMDAWFQPTVDIVRPSGSPFKNTPVIQKGDMLHCDMGLVYLGFSTDTQQLAYVLKEGETGAPEGLKKGLQEGNRLQDILLEEMKAGLSGNQILKSSLEKAKAEGLNPSIYTHPLGFHGHGAGPLIGLWDSQGGVPGRGDYLLFPFNCHSIELNVKTAVPEWNNELITFALEQDAFFDGMKCKFIDKRQEEFYLIR